MKKYYIFAINTEYYEIYKRNKHVLYNTLKNLYELDLDSLNYGLSIYNQLCVPINNKILESYYSDYKYIDNHFMIDNSIIEINRSCIILLTDENNMRALKNLHYYNFPLFVCDFKNDDYFFLTFECFKNVTNIIK